MNRLIKFTVCVLIIAFAAAAFAGCGNKDGKEAETEMKTEKPTDAVTETYVITEAVTEEPAPKGPTLRAVYPGFGEVVSLLSDEMTAWITKFKQNKVDKISDHTEKCEPLPVLLQWENDNAALYSHVLIADNAEMKNAETYLVSGDSLLLSDLYTGQKYYWQIITECEDKTVISAVFSFETLYTPRTIEAEGVSNARDIGGYLTEDGRRMKRGMVYRGGDLVRLTEEGKSKLVNVYGIKTELDLREKSNKGPSPLGEDVNYIAVSGPWYAGAFDESYKADLCRELRVFADADNYPIYFHCSLGRDRTGTLAFLLEALCGVSLDDINKDYEVSFFSDMSGYDDTTPPSTMISTQFNPFRKSIQKYAKGKSLSEAARAFMISIGLTEEEIDAIRGNLTEDVR